MNNVVPKIEKVPFVPEVIKAYTLIDVLVDVCTSLDIQPHKVMSKSRKREVVMCRHIFCHVAKLKTANSLKTIGELIGGRDHTTVIHARQTIKDLFDIKDEQFLSTWKLFLANSKLFNQYDF